MINCRQCTDPYEKYGCVCKVLLNHNYPYQSTHINLKKCLGDSGYFFVMSTTRKSTPEFHSHAPTLPTVCV